MLVLLSLFWYIFTEYALVLQEGLFHVRKNLLEELTCLSGIEKDPYEKKLLAKPISKKQI